MIYRLAAIMLAGFVFFSAASAAPGLFEDRWTRMASLAGDWRGELSYLDYQSGERQAIGQAAKLTLSPDGKFLMSEGRFTDPGFDVYILTTTTIDPATGDLLESFHRDHQIELMRFRVVSEEIQDNGWTLVLVGQEEDDNRPATIRRTMILDNDTLTRRKEVDYLDDEASDFIFRNETVLTRSKAPVTFDDFRRE